MKHSDMIGCKENFLVIQPTTTKFKRENALHHFSTYWKKEEKSESNFFSNTTHIMIKSVQPKDGATVQQHKVQTTLHKFLAMKTPRKDKVETRSTTNPEKHRKAKDGSKLTQQGTDNVKESPNNTDGVQPDHVNEVSPMTTGTDINEDEAPTTYSDDENGKLDIKCTLHLDPDDPEEDEEETSLNSHGSRTKYPSGYRFDKIAPPRPAKKARYGHKASGYDIPIVLPTIREGWQLGTYDRYDESTQYVCDKDKDDHTTIKVPRYYQYIHDDVYKREVKLKLNGKLAAWRKATLKVFVDVRKQKDKNYGKERFEDQYHWAKTVVPRLMKAVDKFDLVPIEILNLDHILKFVVGIDDEEEADFVSNMANCSDFEIIFVPFGDEDDFCVRTRFDYDEGKTYAYGKDSGYRSYHQWRFNHKSHKENSDDENDDTSDGDDGNVKEESGGED